VELVWSWLPSSLKPDASILRVGNSESPFGVVVGMEISEALEFAGARRNGVLATQKRDGRPQLSNITYAVIDGVIKISITADRVKYANLLRNPQASLHISRDDFWAYVVVDGDTEISEIATEPDDPGVEELVDYYRALAGEHPDWDDYRKVMVADKRVIVRLTPTHAYGMLDR
jgi:PPOX class probable F420-dependent enzyme